ncbi:MAG: hypothetical protein UY28_C0009G0010 [Candidatus Amesbacteria bacterium GW2011_GWB1_48_13]|uniref:Uncharacterized protein n=1 Tax=Candidatus Amesbacteria bacterium GW2011_GWB1_48_13 TaxID=1618362 RepID=A0A0G1UVC3_9BACT|nr:MAG: hypothetical protein UY28_C0009G0010 [Candidatus Amesbacteria bacterium GW2011_GWB1_48_13]
MPKESSQPNERSYEVRAQKPLPLCRLGWGRYRFYDPIAMPEVEAMGMTPASEVNRQIAKKGYPLSLEEISRETGTLPQLWTDLSGISPGDFPPTFFGSFARWKRLEIEKRVNPRHFHRIHYEYFRLRDYPEFRGSDFDCLLADTPPIRNYLQSVFTLGEFIPCRGAKDLTTFPIPTGSGIPLQFHLNRDHTHPVTAKIFDGDDFPDTVTISLLGNTFYCTDFCGSLDMDPHRIDIPFGQYLIARQDWRVVGKAVKLLHRVGSYGLYEPERQVHLLAKGVAGTFSHLKPTPEQAASVCNSFIKELSSPGIFKHLDRDALKNLGQTGMLPILVRAAETDRNLEVFWVLNYFLTRAIEYLELPDNREDRSRLFNDLRRLYRGSHHSLTPGQIVHAVKDLSHMPPSWFKNLSITDNDYHRNGWNAHRFINRKDRQAWDSNREYIEEIKTRWGRNYNAHEQPWPESIPSPLPNIIMVPVSVSGLV